jgi:hypothetical protein
MMGLVILRFYLGTAFLLKSVTIGNLLLFNNCYICYYQNIIKYFEKIKEKKFFEIIILGI